MRFLVLITTLFWLVLHVSANTEIVNIQVSEHLPIPSVTEITRSWPVIDPLENDRRWDILPVRLHTPPDHVCRDKQQLDCPHDLWLVFALDHPQWTRFSKFTFRISWPASSPTDFHIHIYTPSQLERLLQATTNVTTSDTTATTNDHPLIATRNLYARIRLIDTGVPIPSSNDPPAVVQPVAFIAILEPLYLALIPQSLVPTIMFLIPLVLVSAFVLFPRILVYLQRVAEAARKEVGLHRD